MSNMYFFHVKNVHMYMHVHICAYASAFNMLAYRIHLSYLKDQMLVIHFSVGPILYVCAHRRLPGKVE